MEQEIKILIQKALKNIDITADDIQVEHPADFSHGDYSTNVALVLGQQTKENPIKIFVKALENAAQREERTRLRSRE